MKRNWESGTMFRGKDIDTGKWVYGSLLSDKIIKDVKNDKEYYLIFNREWDLDAQINYLKDPVGFEHCKESVCKVIPESVGQYIEQKDEDGNKMFEKDIVESFWHRKERSLFEILYIPEDMAFRFRTINDVYWAKNVILGDRQFYIKPVKIIGNTIDNPELLGKK